MNLTITEEDIKRIIRNSGDYKHDPPNPSVAAGEIFHLIQLEFKHLEDVKNHMNACRSLLNAADDEVLYQEILNLKQNLEDLNNPVYCEKCGSCGESGCCPPDKCVFLNKEKKCLYKENSQKDWDDLNKEIEELNLKLKKHE